MTRRSWLIGIAALVVVGVVIGVLIAVTGGGGGPKHKPAAGRTSSPAAPPKADVCPDLSPSDVASALHVPVTKASPTGAAVPTCAYRDGSGRTVLTLSTANDSDLLVLHTFGSQGAVRVPGLGGYAAFALQPPRLAFGAGAIGVLLTVQPAGYRTLLPGGALGSAATERAKLVPALTTLAKAAQHNAR